MAVLTTGEKLTVNMRTAIALLEIFVVAIVLAFLVTLSAGTFEMQAISVSLIIPIIILSLVLVYYCRKGKAWSFVGASIIGVVGVGLRVVVSSQPNLEVGGGLPVGVTVLYIVLGTLVALKSYESVLESRAVRP